MMIFVLARQEPQETTLLALKGIISLILAYTESQMSSWRRERQKAVKPKLIKSWKNGARTTSWIIVPWNMPVTLTGLPRHSFERFLLMIVMPYTCALGADKFVNMLNRWGLMCLRVGTTCSSIVDVLLRRFSLKQHRDRWMGHTGRWKVGRLSTSTQLLFYSVRNPSALSSTSSCKPARSTLRTWRELIIYGWLSWLLIITKQMMRWMT